MKKSILSFTAASLMVVGLVGCAANDNNFDTQNNDGNVRVLDRGYQDNGDIRPFDQGIRDNNDNLNRGNTNRMNDNGDIFDRDRDLMDDDNGFNNRNLDQGNRAGGNR